MGRPRKHPLPDRTKEIRIRKYLPHQVAIDVLNLYAKSGLSMGDFKNEYIDLHKYADEINRYNRSERGFLPALYNAQYDKIYNTQYYIGHSTIISGKTAPEEYSPTISYFADKFLTYDEHGAEVSTTIFNMYLLEVRGRFPSFFTTQSNFDENIKRYLGDSVKYEFYMNHMIVCGVRFSDYAIKKYNLDAPIPRFIPFEESVNAILNEYFDVGPQFSMKSKELSDFMLNILREKNLTRSDPSQNVYEIPWAGWIIKVLNDREYFSFNHTTRVMYGMRLKGGEDVISLDSMIERSRKMKHEYFSKLYEYLSSDPKLEPYRKKMEKYL